jgi:DNA-binding MarR family transcriptional regulator
MDDARAGSFIRFLDEFHRVRGRIAEGMADAYEERFSDVEGVVLNAVAGAASPPTVPQIGRSLGHARQVIQRAANALIERGLIATVPNPDHKRAHRLVATERGLAIKRQADRRGLELAKRITSGLDQQVIDDACAALHTMREALENNLRHEG